LNSSFERHLLSNVFSSAEDIKTDLYKERLLQETMDKDPNCRSFAWKVLRQAKLAVGATTCIGGTAHTALPFFDNTVRGNSTMWGFETIGPQVINGLASAVRIRLSFYQYSDIFNDIFNTTTERFKLYRKLMGPVSGLQ